MIRMLIGTYTSRGSRGIYGIGLDETAGTFTASTLAAETPNPSFLALTADRRRLYATCDPGTFDGKSGGGVAAFSIDPTTGRLAQLGPPRKSGDGGNCFVSVTPDGRAALAADYGHGTVALLPITSDGTVESVAAVDRHVGRGPDADRQESAHAHSVYPDATGRFALSCDLGTDEIYVYSIDTPPGLTRHGVARVTPGSGPRHLAFSPKQTYAYVLNELDNTIDVFRWDATAGTLTHVHRVPTLPADFKAFSKAAEVAVHPTGAFVYASNRGHDSIAVFHVDRETGQLSVAGHTPVGGKEPRHFAVDPGGRFLVTANQKTDALTAFRIDPQTGALTATGTSGALSEPVCVLFLGP